MWPSFNAAAMTENTITELPALMQNLAEVRQKNYALDVEEYEYGVFCVGTVLMGNVNQPMGAISISGNSLTPEEEASIVEVLVPAAKRLSNLLGYIGDVK